MRLALKILAVSTALLVLVMLLVLGDLVLNRRRVFYAMLGRDRLVEACMPALVAKLKASGFEPADVALGETPDITISTATGRSFQDTFTFQDGAAQARVDGVLACLVKDGMTTVEFKTSVSPVRAT